MNDQPLRALLKEHIEKSNSDREAIMKSLNRIETAFYGDEKAGIDGVVKRLDKVEKFKGFVQRGLWVLGGGGLFTGGVFNWEKIRDFFKHL